MQISYTEFCYSDSFTIDGKSIESKEELKKTINVILNKVDVSEQQLKVVLRELLWEVGEYQDESHDEPCEACGHWDSVIALTIEEEE